MVEKGDKMVNTRPLLRLVIAPFQQLVIFSTNLSVDEQMVPYFGWHGCKIFIKGKPIHFGYKLWILSSSSGYPFHIDVHYGKTHQQNEKHPLGMRIVMNVLKCVEVPTNLCI